MNLFFCSNIQGELATLDETESKHAVKVLRIKPGDHVSFIDGQGGWYEGTILEASPRNTIISITSSRLNSDPLPYYLHLAVAPTKNIDRYEWILEKATELGISRITPIICHHSERKNVKTDRSKRVVLSAVKQSLKSTLPVIDDGISFDQFIQQPIRGTRLIAHCLDQPKVAINETLGKENAFTILIGPEGDFSQAEVEAAQATGFASISLGKSRLRTETAAIAACTAIYLSFV